MQDSVDGRLPRARRDRLVDQLREPEPDPTAAAPKIATQVAAVLESHAVEDRLSSEGWVASGRARAILERILPTRVERWLVYFALAWTALQAVVAAIVLLVWDKVIVGGLQLGGDSGPIEYPAEPLWSLLMLSIAVAVGIGSAVAFSLLRHGRDRQAMNVAAMAVLVGMVAGDMVAFYAFQFGALASAVVDLLLLGLVLDYRIRVGHREASTAVDEPAAES